MILNFNFIKLNEQAEKLIKLNFSMVNMNANMVNVNKKSYIIHTWCSKIKKIVTNFHVLRVFLNLQSPTINTELRNLSSRQRFLSGRNLISSLALNQNDYILVI